MSRLSKCRNNLYLYKSAKAKYDIPDKDGHVAKDLARKKEIKKLIPEGNIFLFSYQSC